MKAPLQSIINKLRTENKDYTNFSILLEEIRRSEESISKDEILDLVVNDYRLQLHTTPNSLAKLVSDLVKDREYCNAIDICCGTGNILYYLQNQIDNLTGVEINENVAALTSYFNPDINLITADSFQYTFPTNYDLVVGNLPWGLSINYEGKQLKAEEAFIRKAFELCSTNGDIVLIVPYTILFNSSFNDFRKEFASHLKLVLGLPSGTMRNSSVKTAILHFSRQKHKKTQVGLIDNLNDLDKPVSSFIQKGLSTEEMQERWDPEYFINQDKAVYKELAQIETKKLSELASIIKGRHFQKEELQSTGDFIYLKPIHIQGADLDTTKSMSFIRKDQLKDIHLAYIAQPGDIIISTVFNELKLYVYKNGDPPAIISNNLAIIRSSNDDYILSYLQTEDGKRIFSEQAQDISKGIVVPVVSIKDLQNIRIPILPFSELNQLGNRSIEKSNATQLESMLAVLNEYKEQVLALKSENTELKLAKNFFEDRFERIENKLNEVNQKLDTLLEEIRALSSDFKRIKELPREEEERLFKLYQSLDQKLDSIYKEQTLTIDNYIEEIKRWLDLWELLDKESQKFLPIAEFIFDELSRIPEADYSPFVVQYCRSLENEILKKLFEAYHSEGLIDVDVAQLITHDLGHPKTGKFADMVKRGKTTYTMGDMNFIMSLLKSDGNTLKESYLLQHFRDFATRFFDNRILETSFLNDLKKITSDYRNKAAHPYVIGLDLAKECQLLLRKNLNLFLESKKTTNGQ